MKFVLSCVFYSLCVNLATANRDTYKAGIINVASRDTSINSILPLINKAAESAVDILLLPSFPSDPLSRVDNYDEEVQIISEIAKKAKLYIVAHLLEPNRCQNKAEVFRSNLVFDREGSIISVYRKPLSGTKCNSTMTETGTFTSDIGVQFGVFMEEDIVLQNLDSLKNIRNFLVTGASSSEIPFLNVNQFSSSWAYINNANLISSSGIYAGKTGLRIGEDSKLTVVELNKFGETEGLLTPPLSNINVKTLPSVDLSQYIVKPLNIEASVDGYRDTVCYNKFCCDFYIKTNLADTKQVQAGYGLAVFNGISYFGQNYHIGTQNCAVISAGLFKKTCVGCENNNSSMTFERISISGNFSKENSAQFPMISTTEYNFKSQQFSFNKQNNGNKVEVSLEVVDANVMNFGIFGRDFSKDFEAENIQSDFVNLSIYDYLLNEDVQEFVDYIWIRLRVLIFIVSIYVLEMM